LPTSQGHHHGRQSSFVPNFNFTTRIRLLANFEILQNNKNINGQAPVLFADFFWRSGDPARVMRIFLQ
jgi:hypothetical protein